MCLCPQCRLGRQVDKCSPLFQACFSMVLQLWLRVSSSASTGCCHVVLGHTLLLLPFGVQSRSACGTELCSFLIVCQSQLERLHQDGVCDLLSLFGQMRPWGHLTLRALVTSFKVAVCCFPYWQNKKKWLKSLCTLFMLPRLVLNCVYLYHSYTTAFLLLYIKTFC